MCRREELREGAYLKDSAAGKLYEVRESPNRTHVRLTDVREPVGSQKFTPMPVQQALQRLELVQPGPDPANTASAEEWGEAG